MNAASLNNSKLPRKQLSDQLDRLDSLLDALSEGLNGAVADAAREGTRLAVKDAIVEIMTDPTLRARLHEATAPEPAPKPAPAPAQKPGFWARLKAKTGQAVAAVVGTVSKLIDGAARTGRKVADGATGAVHAVQGLGSLRNLALVGVGVGVTVGVASFLAPPAVAAALSGLSGAVAATAIQLGVWTRRTFRALSMV